MSFRFKWAKVRSLVYISFAHKLNRARWLMFTDTITSCFASLSPSVFFFSPEFLYHHMPIHTKKLFTLYAIEERALDRSSTYIYSIVIIEPMRPYLSRYDFIRYKYDIYDSISTIHAQISHEAVSFTDKKWFFTIHSKHLAISFHSFFLILI